MRKALIVGIDYYENMRALTGCVNDAFAVNASLERNADGTINFPSPRLITASGPSQVLKKPELKEAVRELFADDAEIALFYFAGHGYIEDTGGYLCASDSETGDDGLSLAELMSFANSSPASNKVLILDSCHGGAAGGHAAARSVAELSDGVTIMTASTAEQYSLEVPGGGSGVFTDLFVDALNGGAANLIGEITPGSVYAHIDQSLGPWAQRPVFKTNVRAFVSLRRAKAPIELEDLQALTAHFPDPTHSFRLDPTFEPERTEEQKVDGSIPPPDPANNATFSVLQKYVRVNLVRPIGAPHMWHAAMNSELCELTVLGQHYWRLVSNGLI